VNASVFRPVISTLAAAALLAPAGAALAQMTPPAVWPVYGRTVAAHRYSPLDQISTANVGTLAPAWKTTLGAPIGMEGTPLVSHGVMYVTTGKSAVYALDAKTGQKLWSYVYPLPATAFPHACCNYDNRGVTISGPNVVTGTLDAHLIALNAKTGKVVWNTTVANVLDAYTITSPPLPVNGLLVTGVGGGEFPTRGFIAAYSATTGKLVWKRYTIPGPGEAGYDTWGIPGGAARGGGATWLPGAFDPKSNTVYWGVGNPNPVWDPNGIKGAALYTSSMLALDAATGKIKWYYQFTPHNFYDYDGVGQPVLADLPINGKIVHALAHADRNGYFYLLNRDTGKLIYAQQFVDKVNWGTVSRNGTITVNAAQLAAARAHKPFALYPAVLGGANWEPPAYDPVHHVFFIPALESWQTVTPAKTVDLHPKKGLLNFGGLPGGPGAFAGSLSAWDLTTGTKLWKHRFRSPAFDGALVTAGGLVFIGEMDGKLDALDATTGQTLWSAPTGSGITAPPMSYALGGHQYITVEVGQGGVFPMVFLAFTPWLKNVPQGSAVYTYSLPMTTASR
jgi:alcohol dehydrogenase (cytochrome c)